MKKLTRDRVVPIISARGFLTKFPDDRLNRGFFAEIRQKQKDPGQPLLAGIE